MNGKATEVLDNLRKTLEHDLGLANTSDSVVVENDADDVEEQDDTEGESVAMTEAEIRFCEQGLAFIDAAQYEMEGFESVGPEEIIEALEEIAADDKRLAPKVIEFFKQHGAEAV